MIEYPETVVLAHQVNQTLVGKTIIRAQANQSPHKFAWYTGDPDAYNSLLAGKKIIKASALAWNVKIEAAGDGDTRQLVISVPMHLHQPGEKLPARHQLLLEFDDCSILTCTVQMWGTMQCLGEGETSSLMDYEEGAGKPYPTSDAFDWAYFLTLFDEGSGKMPVKEFLATRQRIPGLGNGVLQDILWTARIHPRRKVATLSEQERHEIFTSVKSVMKAMIDGGGRDTERDLYWNFGGYKTILSKNTTGTGCPNCGTMIAKEPFLGGAIYYCEVCQKV